MLDSEQDGQSLSDHVVREAVSIGMDTEFRDSIVDAVEEAEGTGNGRAGRVSAGGLLLGLGATIGYLVGRGSADGDGSLVEDVIESAIGVEDAEKVAESTPSAVSSVEDDTEAESVDEETDDESGGGLLRKLSKVGIVIGVIAGLELLRRRYTGGDEAEWEPVEEFEPATGTDDDRGVATSENDAEFSSGEDESTDDDEQRVDSDEDESEVSPEASGDDSDT